MESYILQVNSRGDGMEEALAATENAGRESGLSRKETLRLRLLAEELFGMVRSLAGQVGGQYTLEREGKRFLLRLSADVKMTQELRKQLIAVSSQGENAAARSFMGKIRDMIAAALLPREEGPSSLSLGLMSLGSPGGYRAGAYDWSLTRYKTGVSDRLGEDGKAAEAWDELEKSIVARLADEVSVRIEGSNVEIAISKEF